MAHGEHQRQIRSELEKDVERAVFEAERRFLEKQGEALKQNDERWKQMLGGTEERYNAEKEKALALQGSDHDRAMSEHMFSLQEEKTKLLKKCQDDIDKAVRAENALMTIQITKAVATADFAAKEKLQVSERAKRAVNPTEWLQTATSTTKLTHSIRCSFAMGIVWTDPAKFNILICISFSGLLLASVLYSLNIAMK